MLWLVLYHEIISTEVSPPKFRDEFRPLGFAEKALETRHRDAHPPLLSMSIPQHNAPFLLLLASLPTKWFSLPGVKQQLLALFSRPWSHRLGKPGSTLQAYWQKMP